MAVGKMKSAVRVNTFTLNILCDILYTSHMMVRKLCCLGGIDDTVAKKGYEVVLNGSSTF